VSDDDWHWERWVECMRDNGVILEHGFANLGRETAHEIAHAIETFVTAWDNLDARLKRFFIWAGGGAATGVLGLIGYSAPQAFKDWVWARLSAAGGISFEVAEALALFVVAIGVDALIASSYSCRNML
jgi:hypothetical protein